MYPGACAVMALERVPADIRRDGGVARMSDPQRIKEIQEASGARLNASDLYRRAFGGDVVDHYHHAAEWEIAETDRIVTDHDLHRLLERA